MSKLLRPWKARFSRSGGREVLVDSNTLSPIETVEGNLEPQDASEDGQSPTGKRSVYEPARPSQRFQQMVCSQSRAIAIVCVAAVFIILIALIAAFARPSSNSGNSNCLLPTEPPAKEDDQGDGLATNGEVFPWTDIRLPRHVEPVEYDLFLHPNLTDFQFRGEVAITIKAMEAKDFLVFHMKLLNYSTVVVTEKESRKMLQNVKVLEYKHFEQVYVQTKETFEKGKEYVVTIKFNGELATSLVGFYRSSYTTKAGEKRYLATTQFEPTDARAAFPCFDEPQLKATFQLRIVREPRHTTLFNTKRIDTEPYDATTTTADGKATGDGGGEEDGGNGSGSTNLLLDTYTPSVQMSTYLVAFIVCDYANISTTSKSGVTVSVFVPEEQVDQAGFALEAASDMLDYYEHFFGLKYPLEKQDLIAIPDFASGAMENWGLITYRMVALLYDENESSTASQQWVAVVVAHELAHQWFGNLVTMEWWNDLWLNEGFASYVEYLGTDQFKPKWKMQDQFVAKALTAALHSDSLKSSHPISVNVKDPAEINEIFDQISYEKGSSIIRMMEGFLGKQQLEAGLKHYLDKYKFSNAATVDLWKAMNNQSSEAGLSAGVDVAMVMDTWTMQMGYPVVTVKLVGNTITASQKRFLLLDNPRSEQKEEFTSPYDYTWYIPLTYKTSLEPSATQPLHWMNRAPVTIGMKEKPDWIKMNVDFKGFYRVHYDPANWQALIKQLTMDHTVFSDADRANLLDDAFALASSGHLDIATALDLSKYLQREQGYVPWSVALECLKHIGLLIEATPEYEYFSAYMLELMKPLLGSLHWEDTGTHLEKYLRGAILGTAVQLGHKSSVQQAQQMYQEWMQGTLQISPNLKSAVYMGGIKYGNQTEWDFAWNQYVETDVPSEKSQLLYALATTTDAVRLNKFLHLSLDESAIRKGDTVMVIGNIAGHSAGTVIAWRFVKQHWDILNARYGEGSFDMSRLVLITKLFSTDYDYKEVSEFFHGHDAGSGRRAVAQSLERIEMNIDWLSRNGENMKNWLKNEAEKNGW